MATRKKAQMITGTIRCTKGPLNSVLINNDVGGTMDNPRRVSFSARDFIPDLQNHGQA
jgi:hypothetical protein